MVCFVSGAERAVVVGGSDGYGSGLEIAGVDRDVAVRGEDGATEPIPVASVATPAQDCTTAAMIPIDRLMPARRRNPDQAASRHALTTDAERATNRIPPLAKERCGALRHAGPALLLTRISDSAAESEKHLLLRHGIEGARRGHPCVTPERIQRRSVKGPLDAFLARHCAAACEVSG
jgi:hypothetical protein